VRAAASTRPSAARDPSGAPYLHRRGQPPWGYGVLGMPAARRRRVPYRCAYQTHTSQSSKDRPMVKKGQLEVSKRDSPRQGEDRNPKGPKPKRSTGSRSQSRARPPGEGSSSRG
jgi:hypothetical protein